MICHKVFKTWTELTKHSKDEHTQQKEFERRMCGKKQTTASGHRKHMISHEEENLKFECKVCKKNLPSTVT